jgi:hypothetical protein
MKPILILIALGIAAIGCAQTPFLAPEWKVTVQVMDETGHSVPDAQASIGYVKPHSVDVADSVDGKTDTNGLFTASGRSYSRLYLNVKKSGYYSAGKIYDIYVTDKPRYEPWNPTITLILKKIGNPIPMYARRKEEGMVLQKENEPMGFDLKAGDWVAPYGTGFHTDIIFTLLHRQIISRNKFDCILKVSFPNKGDGICVAPSEEFAGSAFKTSRTAAENGYEPELNYRFINTELVTNVFGYFIRVETSLDENGNVKSALYGKISGNFKFYAGTIKPHSGMGFDYYLNPTPNDRNLEFDPKHNLSTNLKLLEGVNEP